MCIVNLAPCVFNFSLATPSLTREGLVKLLYIVELCNLAGFDDVTSSGATRCDQVIAIS